MYAGYSKERKLQYERQRRARNRVEKREAQVLKPWLRKKYGLVYKEFMNYYTTLQNAYPTVKNLAVTREFKEFMGKSYRKFIFFVIFLCFNYVFCLLDTQQTTNYSPVKLFVPHLRISSEVQSPAKPRSLSAEDTATIVAAVSNTTSETPTLERLMSPDYIPSPQPERQPPSPATPVYDPLWSPPPPPPSPESNLREAVSDILTDLSTTSSRSGLDTPPFYPETPLSYESLDVSRDISDWDDLSDAIDEVIDTSDNF